MLDCFVESEWNLKQKNKSKGIKGLSQNFPFESIFNYKFESCQKFSDKQIIWEEENDTPKSETNFVWTFKFENINYLQFITNPISLSFRSYCKKVYF